MLEELQRRNFAPTTIATYLHAVEQFARHFKCRPDWLNQTHFRSYQAYLLRERKLMPHTVRLHVAALRFFFVKTLKRRYLLDDTPYPKAPRRLPQILSVEEVARVIDAADSLSHRTMLMVLYSTGMRNAERPRRCCRSRPIRNAWAPRSGDSWPFTPGANASSIIRTSTVSCRPGGSRRTAPGGSTRAPPSFSR
jgi:integrase